MFKTIILSALAMLLFTACLHKENPEPAKTEMKKEEMKKVHHKVMPKLSHSFYN